MTARLISFGVVIALTLLAGVLIHWAVYTALPIEAVTHIAVGFLCFFVGVMYGQNH